MAKQQLVDLQLKKAPRQARAKATVQAIIQASAQVLAEEGYAALTTNGVAERAGVSIGSVYEYFPGKEAIVAAVATELVEGLLAEMHVALEQAEKLPFEKAMQSWIYNLYQISLDRNELLKALLFQVPFIHQVPAVAGMRNEFFRIALMGASKTREYHLINPSLESLYLITTMTGSTLLQLAMMPPRGLNVNRILDEMTAKMVQWMHEIRESEQ